MEITQFIWAAICKPYGKHMPKDCIRGQTHIECAISDNYMIHPLSKRIKWFYEKNEQIDNNTPNTGRQAATPDSPEQTRTR